MFKANLHICTLIYNMKQLPDGAALTADQGVDRGCGRFSSNLFSLTKMLEKKHWLYRKHLASM